MIIGIPKEIKDHEYRVSLTPDGVRTLVEAGHTVLLESTAGEGSGLSDIEYIRAGAEILTSRDGLFSSSEMIVKVKEPLKEEWGLLKKGQILITFLHLAANKELTERLIESQVIAVGYETIESQDGSLPVLKPMSEIAGRMAVQVGAFYLQKTFGGSGILLPGLPGVEPGNVLILGAGIAGMNAARVAVGLGARVTIVDRDLSRMRYIDDLFQGRANTVISSMENIERFLLESDLIIGAVLVHGAKAPRLVKRSTIPKMKKGSVIVDISVDQGGCFETTRPTTHSDPIYIIDGVIHYCVTNIPGVVPRTSTFALTNTTLPYIFRIAENGIDRAAALEPDLCKGINLHKGRVVHRSVAEAFGLGWEPIGA